MRGMTEDEAERQGNSELDVEAMRREIGTREGDQLIADAVAPRTAAATAARIRGRLDRHAEELRAAGFLVFEPERADEITSYLPVPGVERHEFAQPLSDDVVGMRSMPWAGGAS